MRRGTRPASQVAGVSLAIYTGLARRLRSPPVGCWLFGVSGENRYLRRNPCRGKVAAMGNFAGWEGRHLGRKGHRSD